MTAGMQVGDIGTGIVVIVKEYNISNVLVVVDVSTATEKKLILKKPDGTIVSKDAEFKTTGADGALIYTTVAGDIDVVGHWQLQAQVSIAFGTWRSNVQGFVVSANL